MILYTTHFRLRDSKFEALSRRDIHNLANGGAVLNLHTEPPFNEIAQLEKSDPRWRGTIIQIEFKEIFPDVGTPWVRDPENPCSVFLPGPRGSQVACAGDGHYLCRECCHCMEDKEDETQEAATEEEGSSTE
jgi:hypothetical protein